MSHQPPKGYYQTFEITENDDGIRPAGKPDECFYCHQGVGEKHKDGCVITWRDKEVNLVAKVRFTESVPEHWTEQDILFRYNESTWCAGNLFDRFDQELSSASCGCDETVVELEK